MQPQAMSLLRCRSQCRWILAAHFLSLVWLCNGSNVAIGNGIENVSIENDVLHFAYELERWLNTSVHPCQDFYGFVCGKTLNVSETQLEQERQQKFEQFFTKENNDDELLMDAELKLKRFYLSCKEEEPRSVENLKGTLMYRTSGGWPAIDDSTGMIRKRRNMTWLDVLGAFHEAGFEYFLKTRIEIKSNKRFIHLEPDTRMHYTLRKFEQLSSEVLQNYSVEAMRARLIELEIMNFERNRREIAEQRPLKATNDEVQEATYESLRTTLFGNVPQAQLDAYFKRVLGKKPKSGDAVLVRQSPKLVKYFELLQNTTMTRFLNWIWIDHLMDKSPSECQSLVRLYFAPVYQHIVEHAVIDKVRMAQMVADIGHAYDEVLLRSTWIDEMSQRLSKQFHGRVMHLTLNGDSKLDEDLKDLTISKSNFYRNVEKMQRHLVRARKRQQLTPTATQSHEVGEFANEFMKIFLAVGSLLRQQNLTMPLNYFLVGERFAQSMIASGSTSMTPGAWRSMDSEREFATFRQCLSTQTDRNDEQASSTSTSTSPSNYNLNDLLLRILAQHQTLHALDAWKTMNSALWQRLDRLLGAGRLQLTLRKLYFVGSLLTSCRQSAVAVAAAAPGNVQQRQLVHSYLRNSQAFTQAFGCRSSDKLYALNPCKVL